MVTIIILIIVLILALVIVPFTRQIVKDKEELAKTPINEKFQILIAKINDGLLDGKGEITLFDDDPRLMNLMSEGITCAAEISFLYKENIIPNFSHS